MVVADETDGSGELSFTYTGSGDNPALHTDPTRLSSDLNNNLAATQALNVSDHPTETFTVAVIDNSNATASTNVVRTDDHTNEHQTPSALVGHDLLESGGVANGTLGPATSTATITRSDVD